MVGFQFIRKHVFWNAELRDFAGYTGAVQSAWATSTRTSVALVQHVMIVQFQLAFIRWEVDLLQFLVNARFLMNLGLTLTWRCVARGDTTSILIAQSGKKSRRHTGQSLVGLFKKTLTMHSVWNWCRHSGFDDPDSISPFLKSFKHTLQDDASGDASSLTKIIDTSLVSIIDRLSCSERTTSSMTLPCSWFDGNSCCWSMSNLCLRRNDAFAHSKRQLITPIKTITQTKMGNPKSAPDEDWVVDCGAAVYNVPFGNLPGCGDGTGTDG
jgi:hypothetical protein